MQFGIKSQGRLPACVALYIHTLVPVPLIAQSCSRFADPNCNATVTLVWADVFPDSHVKEHTAVDHQRLISAAHNDVGELCVSDHLFHIVDLFANCPARHGARESGGGGCV
jgi:hypothetical protein